MATEITDRSFQPQGGSFSGLAGFGFYLNLAGSLLSAVGGFYQAKTQKFQLQSQALSMEFQASMSNINARSAEEDANYIMESGQREVGQLTMQAGQVKAAQAASATARGVKLGVGSVAEHAATIEYVKQADAFQLRAGTVRAAEAQRASAVDERNQSLIARVSARNLRGAARSVSPFAAAGASLLGSAGSVASQLAYNRRYR